MDNQQDNTIITVTIPTNMQDGKLHAAHVQCNKPVDKIRMFQIFFGLTTDVAQGILQNSTYFPDLHPNMAQLMRAIIGLAIDSIKLDQQHGNDNHPRPPQSNEPPSPTGRR